jgi:(1->4)-alpha-D-glucan 1-alpha-D-glucosylmutase
MTALRVPVATYRIQFSLNFRFQDARDLVPYLHELGISDLYASPRFKARKGSSHGYDVADPQRVSSELGTEQEFEELVQKLRHYQMGLLLDIVPNHMAASHENPWWMDVLENGPSSAYAGYFDIDWHPAASKAAFLQDNRVLLPVLGSLYGDELENQKLTLRLDERGFFIRYYEHRFPLDPKSYGSMLRRFAERRRASSAAAEGTTHEVDAILELIEQIPGFTADSPAERERRRELGKQIKERVWRLYHGNPESKRLMDEVLHSFSGSKEDAASIAQLDSLLAAQPYRLAHWRIGREELNYRRFFDINDLVGLRVEDPVVFADRHRVILQLVREGSVTGLRVDHVDGLYDPLSYLRMLQQCATEEPLSPCPQNLYVAAEKILGERESLPEEWPVAGTTGYDFLNAVNALSIDPEGLGELETIYSSLTGTSAPFAEVCYAGNKKVMNELFSAEIYALSYHLGKLAALDRNARDLPLHELVQLLTEVTACLPVYRTYARSLEVAPRDRVFVERALELARRRAPVGKVSDEAFAFLRRVLLLEPPPYLEDQKAEFLGFVMRWQQFTGPVMAKGLEDTACYVHNSLLSLNEVGSDPLRESLPLEVNAFHLFNQERQKKLPLTLNATSTHDTKRSEDVRARINVLSELTGQWGASLFRWSRWNNGKKRQVKDHVAPAPHEEVALYQTLLGGWPLDPSEVSCFKDRVKAYMLKAAREAKIYTDWLSPDEEHEAAVGEFVDAVLDQSTKNRFLADFLELQRKVAYYGALNSLAQVLLKIAAPGVPDFYQGTELWDFSLTDPDNRRPVDFGQRVRLLESLQASDSENLLPLVQQLLEQWQDGRIKLYLTAKGLAVRRGHARLFQEGAYIPLEPAGKRRDNVCSFARRCDQEWVVAAAPRLLSGMVDVDVLPLGKAVWGNTVIRLPREAPKVWRNALTGEKIAMSAGKASQDLRLSAVFSALPVALLVAEAS